MKITRFQFLYLTLFFFTTHVAGQSPVNGGFENINNLTTDWLNPSGLGSYASNLSARTGNYALGYTTTLVASSSTQSINPAVAIGVVNNAYFHAIAWVKGSNTSAKVSLGVTSSSAAIASANPAANTEYTVFERRSYDYRNTTGSTQNWMLRLRGASATSGTSTTIIVDDVIMYANNTATSDLTKPTAPSGVTITSNTSNSVSMSWTNGSDAGTGIQQTIVLRTTNLSATAPILNDQAVYSVNGGIAGSSIVSTDWTVVSTTINAGSTSFTDNFAIPNKSYKYAIVHRDLAWNYSIAALSASATTSTPTDNSAPSSATNFSFTGNATNSISLSWTNGIDNIGIRSTIILRTSNISASTPEMVNQTAYSVDGGIAGSNIVSTDWVVLSINIDPNSTSFTDNSVVSATSYKYAIIHRDADWNYSLALTSPVTRTPLTLVDQNIFSVLEYNADPTGNSDSSPAFFNALSALKTAGRGVLYIPTGTYLLNSQDSISGSDMRFEIKGDGVDKSIIKCNNSKGGIRIYSLTRASQISFHDFSIVAMQPNSGTALEFSMLSGGNRQNRSCMVENINIINQNGNSFSTGLNVRGQWRQLIKNVNISGSPFVSSPTLSLGIDVSLSYTPRVLNCSVSNAYEAIVYTTDAGQGGDFVGNTISNCVKGLRLDESTGVQPHLNVENNSFNCLENAITIKSRKIIFIKNNSFTNGSMTQNSNYTDIYITRTSGITLDMLIVNNTFNPSLDPTRRMIFLDNDVANIYVRKNYFNSSGVEFYRPNNATGCIFEDNSFKSKRYFFEKFDTYGLATDIADPSTNWFVSPTQNNGNAPTIVSATGLGFPAEVTKALNIQAQSNVALSSIYRQDGKKLYDDAYDLMGARPIYIALLLNVSSVGTGTLSGSWFFSLNRSTFGLGAGKIFTIASGNGYKFALAKNADASKVTESTVHSFNTPQVLVMKYTPNTGSSTDDVVSLYVNPNLNATEPASASIVSNETSSPDCSLNDILAIVLQQKGPGLRIGGISAASAWSELSLADTLTDFHLPKTFEKIYCTDKVIYTEGSGILSIYNLQGEKVYTTSTLGKVEVNLAKGIYIARFKAQIGQEIVRKVILK